MTRGRTLGLGLAGPLVLYLYLCACSAKHSPAHDETTHRPSPARSATHRPSPRPAVPARRSTPSQPTASHAASSQAASPRPAAPGSRPSRSTPSHSTPSHSAPSHPTPSRNAPPRNRPSSSQTTDFLALATVPVGRDLSRFATASSLRYRLTMPPDAPSPPDTAFQHVRKSGPGTYELTIHRVDLRHLPPPGPKPARGALARYLAATAILQSNAPEILRLAHQAKGRGLKLAQNLTWLVFRHIVHKGYSLPMGTALQVAQLRRGDCTEHAMLLAALARARKIPSRLASGLVFSRRFAGKTNVFVYHMWTELWVAGRWIPFDATRPDVGVGPTHILLALDAGDGLIPAAAAMSLAASLGRTKIQVLSPRPR